MLSTADNAGAVDLEGGRASAVPSEHCGGRLLAAGPVLVLAFLAEGLLNHFRPPFKLGFFPHMLLTALFLGAMGLYWLILRDRVRPPLVPVPMRALAEVGAAREVDSPTPEETKR